MTNHVSPETGRAALSALVKERSPLGPLKVMAKQIGRYFQIPVLGFRPFVVFGPDANRRVLVTEGDSLKTENLFICLLVFIWSIFTYLFFFGEDKWTYLSIILFWALPPILIQLLFGADILWHYHKLVFWAIFVPGMYLSLMDIVALTETTWWISSSQTTGILFFGILPIEEVLFFFITNVLITFGITLLLANVSQERFAAIKRRAYLARRRKRKAARSLDPQSR